MAADKGAPVIIKRKKVVAAEGHHGGAWKVAYADFVTAMMAFFLLMWLLNATTEQQRKGLADYFSPSIPVARISGGGQGNFGGESVVSEDVLIIEGTGATSLHPTEARGARGAVEAAAAQIEAALSDPDWIDLRRHLDFRVTDEGLVIEMYARPDEPLFKPLSAKPEPMILVLAEHVADLLNDHENALAIAGHLASTPVVMRDNPTWDLSTERANKFREMLEKQGLAPDRVQRVTGHADRDLRRKDLPMDPRNERIVVTLLVEAPPIPLGWR